MPDSVAYSKQRDTLFIIQCVARRSDAPSIERQSALLRWSAGFRGQCVFVWAYASRTAYMENMGELLADTLVLFADPPEHHATSVPRQR